MKFQLIVTGEHLPAFEGPIENEFEPAFNGMLKMIQSLEKAFKGVSVQPVGEIDPDSASITLEARNGDLLLGTLTLNKIESGPVTEETRQELRDFVAHMQSEDGKETIVEGVMGVYSDIWLKTYPLNSPLGVSYTLGDIRSIKGWWQLNWLAKDCVATFMARTVRMYCVNKLGWDDVTFADELELIGSVLQDHPSDISFAEEVVKRACKVYGTATAPDLIKSKSVKQKMLAVLNKSFSATTDNPVVQDDGLYN